MLLCSLVAWGQDDFNPASPGEPGVAPRKLTVKAMPSDGGTVYGGGRYVPETTVGLRVSSATGYVFEKWTDEEGNVLSTSGSYGHVKEDRDEVLTAHFVFSPSAPSEPAEPLFLTLRRLFCTFGRLFLTFSRLFCTFSRFFCTFSGLFFTFGRVFCTF